MFEKLDPRQGFRLQLMNEEGILLEQAKDYPILSDDKLLSAYKILIQMRTADDWAVSLNRQGRMPTYPPNKGQEANSLGAIMALKETDWIAPAFRENIAMFYRGIPLRQIYKYYYGNEQGSNLDPKLYHALPFSVPISTQTLHAVGVAFAEKYLNHDSVAITYVGDGGTSEGDFSEAMNMAGVFHLPVIFYIQNNQWAISYPRSKQTASKTLAEKAFAFGIEGIQVDGNDIQAVYAITKITSDYARSEKQPVVIEGITYRLGAHTTSDDPLKYRQDSEVKEWEKKDPIIRIEKYLLKKELINLKEIEEIKANASSFARREFEAVEKELDPNIDESFDHTFKTMPEILKWQLQRKKELQSRKET